MIKSINILTGLNMKPRSAKATATREKILRTADELFYLHGYNATGLDAIINKAGITKGNFYYYFKSKEALAVKVLEWHFDQVQQETQAMLQQKKRTPLETLFAILDSIQSRQQQQFSAGNICGCFFGNFTLELSSDSTLVRNRLDTIFSRYRESFAALLTQAQTAGEVPKVLDTETEAEMILSLVEGALLLDKAKQEPVALPRAIQFLQTHLSVVETAQQ